MTSTPELDLVLSNMLTGTLQIEGQFLNSSNFTFLGVVEADTQKIHVVYKPQKGERSLWDFPDHSLAKREVAAFELSKALEWDLVPPTVYRKKGAPAGPGSLQVYIDHDPRVNFFTLTTDQRQALRQVVAFDLLANNADRKAGHIILDPQGHTWLIDHGVCFHVEDKLRTVIWDFAGEPIPGLILQDIEKVVCEIEKGGLIHKRLTNLLERAEIHAIACRGRRLLADGQFPFPNKDRRPFPWPPV